eukprot:CAMPEP_0181473720 /NCGR_PEP_ID=MMETSP1110-20121109/40270_1 /TAXON_ID=174948 /ORGANISM="Symbiodinium sp., Strain CCMP421" /LENGTH=206 /DNA_ID=CAMNT_0023598847 /DNA_START=54 /DNA_END=674 /DNA_ORIENTATION=+
MCLYKALGVARSASRESIRASYLQLAKKLHPDVNKAPGAEKKFQALREAYEVLSDDARRREYDRQFMPPNPDLRQQRWQTGGSTTRWQTGGAGGAGGAGPFPFRFTDEEARRARQEHEEMRRRAHAQFFTQFNQHRYHQSLGESLLRFLPLVLPVWTVLMLYSLYRRPAVRGNSPMDKIYWDEYDRAWAQDAYGTFHRLPDLDRLR